MKYIKTFENFEHEDVTSYFKAEPEYIEHLINRYKEDGIMSIENEELSIEGLLNKLKVWDETEHGVEKFIYDEIKKRLEFLLDREITDEEINDMVGIEIRII